MWPPVRPLEPSAASPIPSALVGGPPTAVTLLDVLPGATADAAAARAALRAALVDLAHARQRVAHDPQEIDRWENDGGRVGRVPARAPDERVLRGRERRAWAAQDISQGEVGGAVRAYTRVMRRAGVPLALTLTAIASIVRDEGAAILSAETCAAVQRDAVRSCLQAYFGP